MQSASVEAASFEVRVPHPHVVVRVAHREAGVAPEVLVGEEQHLAAAGAAVGLGPERPLEHGPCVGRRADRAAVAADEGLQRGRRVHVGDGHEAGDVDDVAERVPRLFDRVDVGHVGHRAAGVQVGEDHLLVVAGEHVGRLGHEVHATEHDELGVGTLLGEHREPERVAPGVGPAHHLVALVVVAEDEEAVAEGGLGRADALREVVGVGTGVALRQRALDAQHRWVVPPLRTLRPLG